MKGAKRATRAVHLRKLWAPCRSQRAWYSRLCATTPRALRRDALRQVQLPQKSNGGAVFAGRAEAFDWPLYGRDCARRKTRCLAFAAALRGQTLCLALHGKPAARWLGPGSCACHAVLLFLLRDASTPSRRGAEGLSMVAWQPPLSANEWRRSGVGRRPRKREGRTKRWRGRCGMHKWRGGHTRPPALEGSLSLS